MKKLLKSKAPYETNKCSKETCFKFALSTWPKKLEKNYKEIKDIKVQNK